MDIDREGEGESEADITDLLHVIGVIFPDQRNYISSVRRIRFKKDNKLGFEELEAATAALATTLSDRVVDSKILLALLNHIEQLGRPGVDIEVLRSRVINHAERRWTYFLPELAALAITHSDGRTILQYFPCLYAERYFIARLAEALRDKNSYVGWLVDLLSNLSRLDLGASRILIAAATERGDQEVSTAVFNALASEFGWTPWVSLFAILLVRPDYAEVDAVFETSGDPQSSSRDSIAARVEMAQALKPQATIRKVAAKLLDLTGAGANWHEAGLLARPAEVRAAYVEVLKAHINDDDQLRRCVIEALLWLPTGRAADLAQFAAVAITEAEDRDFLIQLEQVGARMVQYSARAVRAAKFNEHFATGELPTPRSLVQSIAAFEVATEINDEIARTWLGDRNIERLIEDTIARVEARVAAEYDEHGDEGEDRLLSSLFARLAERFSDLDNALEAMARATSASHRAAVAMRYRNVDRREEGNEGIKGAKSFSADLCLIVDPMLNGTSLGRRVTLVQAKRVYRNKKAKIQPTWERSFNLDRDQRQALQQQTNSSVFFFLAPPLNGRGIPVIPTQLVADLSEHCGSGSRLSKEMVGVASRTLSDWLTYDALALRVGDPYTTLVAKAEGHPGGLPRMLLELPTVEVDIALTPLAKEDR